MSALSITRHEEPEAGGASVWPVVGLALAGLALNAVAVPVPWSDEGVSLRLGSFAGLYVASLRGPWWGLGVAAVAAAPLYATPDRLVAEVAAAGVAAWAVRRGQFVTPTNALFWLLGGLALQAVWAGGTGWVASAFAAFASGLLAALVADALALLPAATAHTPVAPRAFGAHVTFPLAVAATAPATAVGLVLGPSSYAVVLATALAGAIGAVAAGQALGARLAQLLARATDEGEADAPSRPLADLADVGELRGRVRRERAELRTRVEDLEHSLADRETAYNQLLRLSESLEERLQLRGVEVEQRSFLLSLSQRHYHDVVAHATDIIFNLDLVGRFAEINAAGERFFGRDRGVLEGRYWHETLAPGYDGGHAGPEGMQSIIDKLHEAGTFEATTVHAAARGEIRLLRTRLELTRDEDGLATGVTGQASDVTELTGLQEQVQELGVSLQRLQAQSRRRERQMNALLGATRVLNSELEIDQLLQHVIETAAGQISAESGFVGLLDEGALALRWYWRASGASWVDLEGPGVERGVTQIVLETRQPYLSSNAAEDPNTDKEFTSRFGIRSLLVFPVFSQSTALLGALALHNFPLADATTHGEDLSLDPADTRFLEGLADIASAAIQQSRLFDQVRRQAETDPLTGLYNRRAFNERFALEVERATRFNRTFALLLLDIDHLKRINDTYGHPIGDAAICTVADVLQGRLRRHDFAARIGGEEYAVIVVEGKNDTACSVARSLLETLRRRDVPRVGHITASLGVAIFPEDGATLDDLVEVADEALYAAKNSGRDRVVSAREMRAAAAAAPESARNGEP
jgi:diguanylate cyclase (GGDEF)-like protein/PAS domain S-box-containing protein